MAEAEQTGALETAKVWLDRHEAVVWWVGSFSLALTLGTIVALPFVVAQIPDDYFATKERLPLRERTHHPVLRWLLLIGKNLLGFVLVVVGLILALPLVPGQGTITALAGVLLLDFPGKRRLEMWVIRQHGVLAAINWLRSHRGRAPLEVWSPDPVE
jgi:hypothetical protein